MRAAIRLSLTWYAAVGALSLLLALVPMPAEGDPCVRIPDLAWLVWVFREVWWFALVLTLPVAVAVSVLGVWRFAWSTARGTAVGIATGLLIALAVLCLAVLTAHCEVVVRVVPG